MAKNHETELTKPMGRQIAGFKIQAREALPDGTLQEQADKANALALAAGFNLEMTAEKMAPKEERAKRGSDNTSREPTLQNIMDVAAIAEGKKGGVAGLRARVAAIKSLADKVGGLDSLDKCLDALEKLKGGDKE